MRGWKRETAEQDHMTGETKPTDGQRVKRSPLAVRHALRVAEGPEVELTDWRPGTIGGARERGVTGGQDKAERKVREGYLLARNTCVYVYIARSAVSCHCGAAAAEFLDAHGGGCGTAAACDMPRKGMTLRQRRCSRQPSFRRQRHGRALLESISSDGRELVR